MKQIGRYVVWGGWLLRFDLVLRFVERREDEDGYLSMALVVFAGFLGRDWDMVVAELMSPASF